MSEAQWQELIKLHGDLAYLACKVETTPKWFVGFDNNEQVFQALSQQKTNIKITADLPFDEIAARNGDIVIFNTIDGWLTFAFKKYLSEDVMVFEATERYDTVLIPRKHFYKCYMKHPRRVGVDYGD